MFHLQQSGELAAYSDVDRECDKATRRSVSAGVIMRGGRCLKVWTKKQRVVSLSTAESELCTPRSNAERGRRTWALYVVDHTSWMPRRPFAWSTAEELGKAELVDMRELMDTRSLQVKNVSTRRKSGANANPAESRRLDDETTTVRTEEWSSLVKFMGYEFVCSAPEARRVTLYEDW